MRAMLIALTALIVTGCNQYEVFLVSGYQQESYSNDADVIFIIDNSSSMTDEAQALALNFDSFLRYLTNPSAGEAEDENLSGAVDDYISYVSERGRLLNYQLGITTTGMDQEVFGGAGSLVGSPSILGKGSDTLQQDFASSLLCEATCWDVNQVPADPEYTCDSANPELPDPVSQQALDCICDGDRWEDNCGPGTEEGLEATFAAMCRAVENPPDECFWEYSELAGISEADANTSEGMIREDSTVIFVIISDEGDGSRRIGNTDPDITVYKDLMDSFGVRYRFAVIGPPYDPVNDSLTCNSGGATTWGTERYQAAAELSGGFFNPISAENDEGDCALTDFSSHLEDLGALLNSLMTAFPLQSVPDTTTIQCFVDGFEVPMSTDTRSTEDQALGGVPVYSDGWSYDPAINSVVFHGEFVPDYNESVRIYYRPLDGMPRTLPF